MLKLNYDKQYDVLYLNIADNSQSYGAEVINGINIFRDLETDSVTGYIVFGFLKKYQSNTLPSISDPILIDFEHDVIPNIFL